MSTLGKFLKGAGKAAVKTAQWTGVAITRTYSEVERLAAESGKTKTKPVEFDKPLFILHYRDDEYKQLPDTVKTYNAHWVEAMQGDIDYRDEDTKNTLKKALEEISEYTFANYRPNPTKTLIATNPAYQRAAILGAVTGVSTRKLKKLNEEIKAKRNTTAEMIALKDLAQDFEPYLPWITPDILARMFINGNTHLVKAVYRDWVVKALCSIGVREYYPGKYVESALKSVRQRIPTIKRYIVSNPDLLLEFKHLASMGLLKRISNISIPSVSNSISFGSANNDKDEDIFNTACNAWVYYNSVMSDCGARFAYASPTKPAKPSLPSKETS